MSSEANPKTAETAIEDMYILRGQFMERLYKTNEWILLEGTAEYKAIKSPSGKFGFMTKDLPRAA